LDAFIAAFPGPVLDFIVLRTRFPAFLLPSNFESLHELQRAAVGLGLPPSVNVMGLPGGVLLAENLNDDGFSAVFLFAIVRTPCPGPREPISYSFCGYWL
jgi:hypothetical protein